MARRSTHHIWAALAAAALTVLPVVPAGAGATDRGTADSCPIDAPDVFTDDEASVHEANINCIAFWGITRGTTSTTYAPALGTRRDQMATFVANFMGRAGFTFPANPPDAFTDDEASVHERNVNALAAAGVVSGQGGGRYAPGQLVRRDQMATFVANAIEAVAGAKLPDGVDAFTDDAGNAHEANIDALAGIGVVVGQTATTYNPAVSVRRDQMASFLAKAADHVAELGRWPAFGDNQSFRVTPDTAAELALGETRAYTAFVADAGTVGVGTVDCDDVTVGTTVSFGYSQLAGYVGGIAPVDGLVSFAVEGTQAGCERPVVYDDADGDGQLGLDAGGRPTEPFGVGGEVTWVAADSGGDTGGGGGGGDGGATGPTVVDVRAHDGGTAGLLDSADVHQFTFSEPLAVAADDPGSLYRVQDADGTIVEVVCGTHGNCVLMPAGTYNGTAYPANQVMRVYVTAAPTVVAAGTTPGLGYPATVTNVSAGWGVSLASSADVELDVAPLDPTPSADSTGPNMFVAVADQSDDTITVTYTEAVVCESSGALQFGYTDSDNASAVAPTGLVCDGTSAVLLRFPDGVIEVADTAANLAYTDDNSAVADSNDIRDLNGNPANATDSIAPSVQE